MGGSSVRSPLTLCSAMLSKILFLAATPRGADEHTGLSEPHKAGTNNERNLFECLGFPCPWIIFTGTIPLCASLSVTWGITRKRCRMWQQTLQKRKTECVMCVLVVAIVSELGTSQYCLETRRCTSFGLPQRIGWLVTLFFYWKRPGKMKRPDIFQHLTELQRLIERWASFLDKG